ncbi:MAG: SufD family Fe-S cluster assembly protein [Sphaerochaetaceae bacterium]
MKLTHLNTMQEPTWSWLKMNESSFDFDIDLSGVYRGGEITHNNQIQLSRNLQMKELAHLPDDLSRLRDFIYKARNYTLHITIKEGEQISEPIIIDFLLDDHSPLLLDYIEIHALKGSKADVVLRYQSDNAGRRIHGNFTSVIAEQGSVVNVTSLQTLGDEDEHLSGVAIVVKEEGEGNAISCELGAKNVVSGYNILLEEPKSQSTFDSLYVGTKNRVQDFNYRLELRGKESDGEISARGVLLDNAKKTLVSTLDFIQGASGSSGREVESVLALSDKVVNLSTPLLLANEDNVQGEHATSIGKPDKDKLYYLMSRGFSQKEALRLVVEASFTPILNKLPTNELKALVEQHIQKALDEQS